MVGQMKEKLLGCKLYFLKDVTEFLEEVYDDTEEFKGLDNEDSSDGEDKDMIWDKKCH